MTRFTIEGVGPDKAVTIALKAEVGIYSLTGHPIKAWKDATYADKWWADALREAQEPGPDARRREIAFALAVAESFLFEWVRDEILKRDYLQIDTYFHPTDFKPVRERWKSVVNKLTDEGKIPQSFPWDAALWKDDFKKLVGFRNGVLHGGASRPQLLTDPGQERMPKQPSPKPDELHTLPPGWAVGVVAAVILQLSEVAGTGAPKWPGFPNP